MSSSLYRHGWRSFRFSEEARQQVSKNITFNYLTKIKIIVIQCYKVGIIGVISHSNQKSCDVPESTWSRGRGQWARLRMEAPAAQCCGFLPYSTTPWWCLSSLCRPESHPTQPSSARTTPASCTSSTFTTAASWIWTQTPPADYTHIHTQKSNLIQEIKVWK